MGKAKVRAFIVTGIAVAILTTGTVLVAEDAFGLPTVDNSYSQIDTKVLQDLLSSKLSFDLITRVLTEHPEWAESLAHFILDHFDLSNLTQEQLERLCEMFPDMKGVLAQLLMKSLLESGKLNKIPEPERSEYLTNPKIDNGSFDPDEEGVKLFSFRASQEGSYHLRSCSFGDYNPNTRRFETEPEWDGSAYFMSPLFFSSMGSYKASPTTLTFEMNGWRDYGTIIPEYCEPKMAASVQGFEGEVPFSSDAENRAWLYDVDYYTVSFYPSTVVDNISFSDPSLAAAEKLYRKWVKKYYTSVPSSEKGFLDRFISENELKNYDDVVSFLKYNYTYEGLTMDCPQGRDIVDYFLNGKMAGTCTNFASAAVLLIRELGYPCRFVQGYLGNAERRNSDVNVTTANAHAWAEVYVSGKGWKMLEPTPARALPEIEPTETYNGNLNDGLPYQESSQTAFNFTRTEAGNKTYYLRSHSYGDYDPETYTFSNETYSPFPGEAPQYPLVYKGEAEPVNISYVNGFVPLGMLEPCYSDGLFGSGGIEDSRFLVDDFVSKDETRRAVLSTEYNADYLDDLDFDQVTRLSDSQYYRFVLSSYTDVPVSLRNSLYKYIEQEGLLNEDDVETHLSSYHTLVEDFISDNPIDDLLFNEHRGNVKGFAGVATLLCRTLQIPARMVEGYKIDFEEQPFANSKAVSRQDKHYWTEVFIQGKGWKRIDPCGQDKVYPTETLTLSTKDVNFVYDGLAHSATADNAIEIKGAELATGDVLEVKFTKTSQNLIDSCSNVRISANAKVYDHWGNEVSDKYNLDTSGIRDGKFSISKRPILVTTNDNRSIYPMALEGGRSLEVTLDETRPEFLKLADGHYIDMDSLKWTDIPWNKEGKYENSFDNSSFHILDKDGNDVTSNYAVTVELGVISVEREAA